MILFAVEGRTAGLSTPPQLVLGLGLGLGLGSPPETLLPSSSLESEYPSLPMRFCEFPGVYDWDFLLDDLGWLAGARADLERLTDLALGTCSVPLSTPSPAATGCLQNLLWPFKAYRPKKVLPQPVQTSSCGSGPAGFGVFVFSANFLFLSAALAFAFSTAAQFLCTKYKLGAAAYMYMVATHFLARSGRWYVVASLSSPPNHTNLLSISRIGLGTCVGYSCVEPMIFGLVAHPSA